MFTGKLPIPFSDHFAEAENCYCFNETNCSLALSCKNKKKCVNVFKGILNSTVKRISIKVTALSQTPKHSEFRIYNL